MEDFLSLDVLNDFPIGLFRFNTIGKDIKVEYCNEHFSKVFEKSIDDCLNSTLQELIKINDSYKSFYNCLIGLKDHNNIIKTPFLKIEVNENTKEIFFQIRLLEKDNNTRAYVGAIYVINDDIERRIDSVKKDLAAFFHNASAVNNSIKDTINSIIATNTTSVSNDPDIVFDKIKSYIVKFQILYSRYLDIALLRVHDEVSKEHLLIVKIHLEKLAYKLTSDGLSKFLIAFVRNTFLMIKGNLYPNEQYNQIMPNEIQKEIINHINSIFLYTNLISLYYIEDEIFNENIEVEELKSALSDNYYQPESKNFNLINPLIKVITNLSELAYRKNIEIELSKPYNSNINVKGDERNLYSAFYNVLNNAIKYSWYSRGNNEYNIKITVTESEFDVKIIFENKGIGIKAYEIESGILFQFGNRGAHSLDSKRTGSGIGLWHTKQIVERFGGKIEIMSVLLKKVFFKEPKELCLTQVFIILPKSR